MKAVAAQLKLPIYSFDLRRTEKISFMGLLEQMNAEAPRCVVLLEEVDCLFRNPIEKEHFQSDVDSERNRAATAKKPPKKAAAGGGARRDSTSEEGGAALTRANSAGAFPDRPPPGPRQALSRERQMAEELLLSFGDILEFLDGVLSPSNCLIFLTTNDRAKLQHADRHCALLRAGRVDEEIEFKNASKAQVVLGAASAVGAAGA